jgi:hypothetical protein
MNSQNNISDFPEASFTSPIKSTTYVEMENSESNSSAADLFHRAMAASSSSEAAPAKYPAPGSGEKRSRNEDPEESKSSVPGSAEKKLRTDQRLNEATPATKAARDLSTLAIRSPGISFPEFASSSSSSSSAVMISPEVSQALDGLENYLFLLDSDGKKLLSTLDMIFFKNRDLLPDQLPTRLYSPQTILNIYNLFSQTYGTSPPRESRIALKNLTLTIQLALKGMTVDQREELLNLLSIDVIAKDPRYTGLSEICFSKYFLQIDPPSKLHLTSLPSYETTLKNVVRKTEREINASISPENSELCRKVQDLALTFLDCKDQRKFPLEHAFHATSPKNIPYMLENGIPVSHQKAYPGAFTSSGFEQGFGSVGVAVSRNRLAAMQQNLTRVERRFKQDGGQVWLGSNTPLPIIPDLITLSSDLSETEVQEIKEMIYPLSPNCLFVPSNVLEKFLEYSREDHWITPVPAMTHKRALAPKIRPSEASQEEPSTVLSSAAACASSPIRAEGSAL